MKKLLLLLLLLIPIAAHADVTPYVTPDNYGAKHQAITLGQLGMSQATINTTYPGLGCSPGTMVDAAAWRKALSKAATTGKMIIAFGTYFFQNDSAAMPKNFRVITIYGGAYIHVTGTSGSPAITRPRPTDNGDANIMIGSFVNINGLQIGCQTGEQANRIGIDIGPTYNSVYKKVDGFSLKESIHLRFALNTDVDNCEATNCYSGWIADIGNWPGAGNANSQSNSTTFRHCRYYGDSQTMQALRAAFPDYRNQLIAEFSGVAKVTGKSTHQKIKEFIGSDGLQRTTSGGVAFGIYGCSNVTIEDFIIEGIGCAAGIDYDALGSTVVKGMRVITGHFECVSGATVAFVKIRAPSGVFVIDFVFGQYPSVMVDAEYTIGYPFVSVSHTQYWVPSPTGKYFKNNGCNWALDYNDNFSSNPADFRNMFTGTLPNYGGAEVGQRGSNTYSALMTGR